MPQIQFSVKDQVRAETQQLAQQAKKFSGLTNEEIEVKLERFGVYKAKGGSRFSDLLTGKVSKIQSLDSFKRALKEAGLLPPEGSDFFFHWDRHLLEQGVVSRKQSLDLSGHHAVLSRSRTDMRADWKAEDKKAGAIEKAKLRAEAALKELADAMDTGPQFLFDLLYEEPLPPPSNEMFADHEQEFAARPSTAEQLRKLAGDIQKLKFHSLSGWNYAELKTGAKVVQSEPKTKPVKVDGRKMKKEKIL